VDHKSRRSHFHYENELGSAAAPIVAWSDADNFPEIMDAMALIGETYGIRDFCY
jgi:hypothetical protein